MFFSIQDIWGIASGGLVGFVLGLVGGGGSILAVPLLVYLVGVPSPHVAIGTSAVGVALSAAANLIGHARAGNVKWRCALVFAAAGIIGAAIGAGIGRAIDGKKLLVLFGGLMIVIAAITAFRKTSQGDPDVRLTQTTAPILLPRLLYTGAGVGLLSGFFGIGGGFLIVPGLMSATGMPMLAAIGSSLVAVTAFGITTAFSYAISGLIDWRLVVLFIGGAVIGGLGGAQAAIKMAPFKTLLGRIFSAFVAAVGLYVIIRGITGD